jgi:error-prone DNA polymerase
MTDSPAYVPAPLAERRGSRGNYAELHCHSYYSLLDASSSPEALVAHAQHQGLAALALTDHDSLAGAVRFWTAARRASLPAVLGAEVTLEDSYHLTLLAETQTGYANLCRLITASRLDQMTADWRLLTADPESQQSAVSSQAWPGKLEPALTWDRLAQHTTGLICLTGCRQGPVAAPLLQGDRDTGSANLHRLLELFGPQQLYVELQHHSRPGDDALVRQLCDLVLPVVATNNVHHATRAGSRLRDALIAIRHILTLDEARRAGLLPLNSNAYLRTPGEMACIFHERPDAMQNTVCIAERCQVSLDFSGQRLPTFPKTKGPSEFAYLYELCHENLPHRYPDLTPQVLKQLAHELDIIERAHLAGYFLIVWDIMREARQRQIRAQGRGSAANSIVAYLLGITSIDPLAHDLLFERFLSEDKFTTPDIDLDFAADRREEIIQYVYDTYGHAHTAMVANTVTCQARSALRDLAKVLAFPAPVIDKLAKSLDTHSAQAAATSLLEMVEQDGGEHEDNHPLRLLAELMMEIDGCPRHLSIHSGGMLITGPRLDEIVPQEPATMPGRVIVQWDKDSVEDAGLIKIDLLGLRMLGLLAEALNHIRAGGIEPPDLDALPLDDRAIYEMLQRGDTVGAFQVESRAQQQMLPRLKPETFADIIVSIAIIRPGPIQGGMVHPYLRRRAGLEPVAYPHPFLASTLQETLGVLLFQEQVLRVAQVLAGFSAGEADLLRRALSRSRPGPEMDTLRARFVEGAQKQGIAPDEAEKVFGQLAGYAGYGFCKSHSASFALIAYQSLWLKRYHPAEFYCALLNQQPMGFYSPEVIIGDARRHGVTLLPPDVNQSQGRYAVERNVTGRAELRMGLCTVKEVGEQVWKRIEAVRAEGPFTSLAGFCRRTRLPQELVSNLIRAGALDPFSERRDLLWQLGGIDYQPDSFDLETPLIEVTLPDLEPLERTVWEYELLGLSPDEQVLHHYRGALRQAGVLSTWQVKHQARDGQRVRVAGMVVVRQRPQTAKGIMFISLEDESGLLDLVVKPEVYMRVRPVLQATALIAVEGVVQRTERVVSVLVQQLLCLTQSHT